MKRTAYKSLLEWKNSIKQKPLVFQGARQVGKTYLINEFGKNEYDHFISLNFEQDKTIHTLFEQNLNPKTIINNISLYIGKKIEAKDTLIFFDEIQVAPHVLSSLKYFQEQAPEYHVIAAGSLLGVSIGKKTSFPVGKVNFLNLFPMSFLEYLEATGEEMLAQEVSNIQELKPFPEAIHNKLLTHLKMYLFIGGMPEVIQNYIDNNDIESVREIQNEIVEAYKRDFSKYTDENQAIKISEFWNSIPKQLAKENKKFKYSEIKKGARASNFEQTIEWLQKTGLISITYCVNSPKKPLSVYADYGKFKVFLHDVGLLASKFNIPSNLIISPTDIFLEFNGAFIENFVSQQLHYQGFKNLYYWTSGNNAEVDFLIEHENNIFPVEVKSGLNRNIKSLRSYADKNNPKKIIRVSPRNLKMDNDFINIPLYATNLLSKIESLI